jgi:hypothetical protein
MAPANKPDNKDSRRILLDPDTDPPEKKVPRLATGARANRRKLDSYVRFYHGRTQTPRGLASVACALPLHAWRQLRKETSS